MGSWCLDPVSPCSPDHQFQPGNFSSTFVDPFSLHHFLLTSQSSFLSQSYIHNNSQRYACKLLILPAIFNSVPPPLSHFNMRQAECQADISRCLCTLPLNGSNPSSLLVLQLRRRRKVQTSRKHRLKCPSRHCLARARAIRPFPPTLGFHTLERLTPQQLLGSRQTARTSHTLSQTDLEPTEKSRTRFDTAVIRFLVSGMSRRSAKCRSNWSTCWKAEEFLLRGTLSAPTVCAN